MCWSREGSVYIIFVHELAMGWLRLVGSLKLQVFLAEYRLFYTALLQKRPIIFKVPNSLPSFYSIFVDEDCWRWKVYDKVFVYFTQQSSLSVYIYVYIYTVAFDLSTDKVVFSQKQQQRMALWKAIFVDQDRWRSKVSFAKETYHFKEPSNQK